MTILEMRQSLGLSQSEFAAKFHLSKRTVQSWEQGWGRPTECIAFMIERIIELEHQLYIKDGTHD